MLITRRSKYSNLIHQMEINVTQEQLSCWQQGHRLIQDVMPDLTNDEREFIMTGVTPEEWNEMWPEDNKPGDIL